MNSTPQLYDARGEEIVLRTPDGWDVNAEIHKPGTPICIERNGRFYIVGPRGEWRRNKELEKMYRERGNPNKSRRIVTPDEVPLIVPAHS